MKDGLWANIHRKRARIKAGSGEKMRKPGEEGRPTAQDLKRSQNEMQSADKKPELYTGPDGKRRVRMVPVDRDITSEKKLTPAEIKKREEIAKSMERDNPNMPMAKKMAIATATAKRVAEASNDFSDRYNAAKKKLQKMKKGSEVSFTHATSGKKVTGTYHGLRNMGGRSFAHVEHGDGATRVPVHQIHQVQEAMRPPFEPTGKAQGTVTDKSGAKHTPMSRARDLARKARDSMSPKSATSNVYKNMMGGLKKESVELDEMRQPFVVVDTADGNKVVAMASDEKGAKSSIASAERPPMSIKDKSTLKIVKTSKKQSIGMPLKEEVELDEAQKLFMFKTKAEADKKAKEVSGKVVPLTKQNFAVVVESVELEEASAWVNAGRALHDYARKSGGMDKADFEKAATHLYKINKANILQKGDHLNAFSKFFKELDTDVRDRIVIILKQNNLMESVEEATNKVKLKGFGPDAPKSNMGNSAARAALRTVKPKNKENTTEANFDQNFSKRIGATMRGGAGAEYLKRKADQSRADAAKQDPGATKKGLGPAVVDRQKAYKKAKEKGLPPGSIVMTRTSSQKTRRLPEKNDYLQTDMKKRKQANDQAVADMKKDAPKHEPSWASNPGKKSFSDIYGKKK
jgi:hypothetical protein